MFHLLFAAQERFGSPDGTAEFAACWEQYKSLGMDRSDAFEQRRGPTS